MSLARQPRIGQRGFSLVELMVVCAVLGLVMGAIAMLTMSGSNMVTIGENRAEAQQGARVVLQMEEDLRQAGSGYPPGQPAFTAASPTSVTFWGDTLNASTTLSAASIAGATAFTVADGSRIAASDTIFLTNSAQYQALTVAGATSTQVTVNAPGATLAYPPGAQVGRARSITYAWDGSSALSKNAGDGLGAQPIATGIQAFQLTYFDVNDAAIAAGNLAANLANIRRVVISATAGSAAGANAAVFTITSSVRPRNL